MKIQGPTGPSQTGAARGAGRTAAGGFSLPGAGEASEAAEAQRMAGLDGVMTVSALLALQGVEDPLQRRKRVGAARRTRFYLNEAITSATQAVSFLA